MRNGGRQSLAAAARKDSRPPAEGTAFPLEGGNPLPPRREGIRAIQMPVWLLLSIGAHLLVFVWIASQVGMALVKRPDGQTQLTVRPEVAAMLKAHVDEQRLPSLREKVEDLAALRNEIVAERNRRLEQLKELAAQKGQELPRLLEETLSGIVESEQRALAQATKANEELQKTEALRTELQAATQKDALGEAAQKAAALNGQLSAVAGIQQAASDEQNRALGLIRDAAALVEWAGGSQGTSLWAKVSEAQAVAGKAMEKAEGSQTPYRQQVTQDAKTLAEAARAAEQAAARLSQAQALQKQAVEAARVGVLNAAQTFSNAQARAAEAVQKAADSRRDAAQAASRAEGVAQAYTVASNRVSSGTAEDKRIAEQLKQSAAKGAAEAVARQKAAEGAGKAAAEAAVAANKAAATLTEKQVAMTEAAKPPEFTAQEQAKLGTARATASRLALTPARVQETQAAVQTQQAATVALTAAAGAIRSAARGKKSGDYYEHEIAKTQANGSKLDADRLDAAQAYQAARNMELEIAGLYREARAAELAMLQGTPMSVALANTQTPVPDHAGVDETALAGGGKNVQGLRQYESALGAAGRELNAMTAAAASMRNTLGTSSFSGSGEGLKVGVANILAQSTNLRALTGLASEQGGHIQDLTAAMAAMEAKRLAAAGHGAGHGATGGAAGGTGSGAQGQAGGAAGASTAGGTGGSGGGGPPGSPGGGNFFGASGNEVGPKGRPAKWFYVGSWYIIGPFPNEGRKNIETVFPPESVIDLNAVYTGTGGKPVAWQYLNAPSCQIEPPDMAPYAIYYAWTEIKMDRDRDLWIVTGSDDRSDLWVNDMPVWRSGNWLKNWNMNEAFRKVHFKQGRNKILVRLENGWGACCFSILINLEGA